MSLFHNSVYFSLFLSIAAYEIGCMIKKRCRIALCNPLLIAIILVIICLKALDMDYENYEAGSRYLSYLLTPATICLAIPLYEKIMLLKNNLRAIIAGVLSGVVTNMLIVLLCSALFRLNHQQYVTLLPKSRTTAIGISVSQELGGFVTITAVVIILTGILGNITSEWVCRLFSIDDPISQGVGIGTASHVIGTARAMEMGEIQGAVSSLSLVLTGILSVLFVLIFSTVY